MPTWPPVIHGDVTDRVDGHTTDALLHSSGQEVAYAENVSGTTQALTTTTTNLASLSALTIPISQRPVWVSAEVHIDVTTTPAASSIAAVTLSLADDAGTILGFSSIVYTSAAATGINNGTSRVYTRLDPAYLTVERVVRLQVGKDGNATFAAQVMNGAVAPGYRSWIEAHYR